MNALLSKILAADKVQHALGGALTGVLTVPIVFLGQLNLALACLAAAVLVGPTYELVRWHRKEGAFSWRDVAATVIGGIGISLIVLYVAAR